MAKKENLLDQMKANPSLEPIARLAELAATARMIANEAAKVGDTLSQFALKGELNKENLPATEAWETLCDFYKHGARDFASGINEAIEASGIAILEQKMNEYESFIVNSLSEMYANDEQFRAMFDEAMRKRKKDGKA